MWCYSQSHLVVSLSEVGLYINRWDQSGHAYQTGHVLAGKPRSWRCHCQVDVKGLVTWMWHGRGSRYKDYPG